MTFLSRDHPFLQLLCKLWGFELGDNVHFGYCAPVLIYVAAVGLRTCIYVHAPRRASIAGSHVLCGDCMAVGWYFYVVFHVVFVHL